MDYSMNSTNLAILSLLAATVIVLCSWEPLIYRPLFLSPNHSSNSSNSEDELGIALEKASMPDKTLIITFVNEAYVDPLGNEYPPMFDLFLEGFWAGEETLPLLDNLLVVAMDQRSHERCRFRRMNCYRLEAGDDLAGEKLYMSAEFIQMMWKRTVFLVDVLKRGYSFIFTDADIIWLRNPFTRLITNETMDLQISTDSFNGNSTSEKNPINTGFYFVRSNERTVALFQRWYDRRNNSTGMKEQDVLMDLVRKGALAELGLNTRFLKTLYFSGFCRNSEDVRLVVTVHANCCRTIKAKISDLKVVLMDWKRSKSHFNGTSNGTSNGTVSFQWSRHKYCMRSWHVGVKH